MKHDFRCDVCGKFIGDEHDSYTNYGGCDDAEPPDPVFLCLKCADEEKEYCVKQGQLFSHWIKADYEYGVAKKLNLALAGSPGAGWSEWYKVGESLPEGYEWKNMEERK